MSRNQESLTSTHIRLTWRVLSFLASLKMAVVLLVMLAAVLGTATVLEARHGSAYSRWYVYESSWFIGLLALLGVNIFCAAASRFPWKRHHTGFVVTHAGLLVVLAGAVQSFWGGVEGRVSLAEGETAHQMTLPHRGQITAFWVGRPEESPFEFTFDGGPVDWPAGKVLDLGEVDGVQIRILGYYQHARPDETWVEDQSRLGGPAVKFQAKGQDGTQVAEGWLVDQQFGDAVAIGPIRLELQRAVSDRMLQDFLQPSVAEVGEKGQLVMYLGDVMERVALDKCLGQRISIGTTGAVVEICEYLPNASPDRLGNFTSKGNEPRNPMVELRIHLPNREQPLRQIAFAKDPLLNLDGVYPVACPVKFRFHHAAVKPQNAVELLQTSDGKLFGRVCSAEQYAARGEIRPGDSFELPGNCRLEIVEYLRHARKKVSFAPFSSVASRQARDKSEPAALVELTIGGSVEQVWMCRNDPAYGRSTPAMPGGTMALSFEHGRAPLGFSLGLIDFRREPNPGGKGNAGYSSKVRVVDSRSGLNLERVISMNEPLTQGNLTLYQSSFDDGGHGRNTSTFSAAYDPGRVLKYSGCLLICLGIAIMFYMRAYFFTNRKSASQHNALLVGRAVGDAEQQEMAVRRAA